MKFGFGSDGEYVISKLGCCMCFVIKEIILISFKCDAIQTVKESDKQWYSNHYIYSEEGDYVTKM